MERAKLIAKIKKLLALAGSHHPHEAAAALRKAMELMAEHGIEELDVELADVSERTSPVGRQMERPPLWLAGLSQVVSEAFGVERIWSPYQGWAFVGVGAAPEVADYAFTVLRRQLQRDRAAYLKKLRGKRQNRIRRADEYALGWAMAVREMVQRFARPVPEIVHTYLARKHGDLETTKARDRGRDRDLRHRVAGIIDGSNVQLQNAMGHSAPAQLEVSHAD